MRWTVPFALLLLGVSEVRADTPFPCSFPDFRVESRTSVYLRCDKITIKVFDFPATLFSATAPTTPIETVQVTKISSNPHDQWMHVKLTKELAQNTEFVLKFASIGKLETINGPVAGPFERGEAGFSTKPSVSIVRPYGEGRDKTGAMTLAMVSRIALDKVSLANGSLSELLNGVARGVPAKFSLFDARGEADDPEFIGWSHVNVGGSGIRSLDTKLSVGGVRNIFGDLVVVNKKDRFILPGAPADKSSSDVYFKFLNQAGRGSKPGWAADIKFAPSLAPLGRQYYVSPEILADIGFGKVEGAKTSDTIKLGLGVSKFYRFANLGALKGLQFTPRAAFETKRDGHNQNILFDGDSQWFFSSLLNSIKDKNFRTYALLRSPNLDPRDMEGKAIWGFQAAFFLGTEIGGRRSEDTVKASSGSEKVVVPTFNIARIRQRTTATFEYRRLTLSLAFTPRYLINTETVTRETKIPDPSDSNKQVTHIFLHTIQGFRPYGEAGVSWDLDYERHYALSVTYKLGSLPPNFDHADTVQTGIVIKF